MSDDHSARACSLNAHLTSVKMEIDDDDEDMEKDMGTTLDRKVQELDRKRQKKTDMYPDKLSEGYDARYKCHSMKETDLQVKETELQENMSTVEAQLSKLQKV